MLKRCFDETGGHGGDLARYAELWKLKEQEIIDFSSNINPLGPPTGLLDYLKQFLPAIVAYPTPQARELRSKLSSFFNIPEERLLLGNGANELIHLLVLWKRPRRVLIPAPSFSEYERAAALSGALIERYELPLEGDFDHQLITAQLEPGDMVIFCNPNNPTGRLYQRENLLPLVKAVEATGALIMIDESFIPLTGKEEESLRDLESASLWIAVSLTKVWSMPGLRLGALIGPSPEVQELTCWGDPWRVNLLAQKAGLYCLEAGDYLARTLQLIEGERHYLEQAFRQTGYFKVFPGSANFLLMQGLTPNFMNTEFQDFLAVRGLLVRRADNFYGLDHSFFRIAVRSRAENSQLIAATHAYLADKGLTTDRDKEMETSDEG